MKSPNVDVVSRKGSLLWQLVDNLDEQRLYPRVPLNIKAAFVTDTGSKFSAAIINISPDGLQMRCTVESARLFCPQGRKIDPLNTPGVNAAISLPVGIGSKTFTVRCQILYLRTVDTEPRCVAGMRFVQLGVQSERVLTAFFADQLMHEAPEAEVAQA